MECFQQQLRIEIFATNEKNSYFWINCFLTNHALESHDEFPMCQFVNCTTKTMFKIKLNIWPKIKFSREVSLIAFVKIDYLWISDCRVSSILINRARVEKITVRMPRLGKFVGNKTKTLISRLEFLNKCRILSQGLNCNFFWILFCESWLRGSGYFWSVENIEILQYAQVRKILLFVSGKLNGTRPKHFKIGKTVNSKRYKTL